MPFHSSNNEHVVRSDLERMIRRAEMLRPRSMQQAIGPSQVGMPCPRRLCWEMHPEQQAQSITPTPPSWAHDPVPSVVGTAVHTWLEGAAATDNIVERAVSPELEHPRWLTEQRVFIPGPVPLEGSVDLYDRWTNTVIDWKTVGPTTMRKVQAGKGWVSPQYLVQVHLYGLGWSHTFGLPPEMVAIAFLPRNGPLRDLIYWTEEYNPELAMRALARLNDLQPRHWREVAPEPTDECRFCPIPTADCSPGKIWR
jgi:hypothetical protein